MLAVAPILETYPTAVTFTTPLVSFVTVIVGAVALASVYVFEVSLTLSPTTVESSFTSASVDVAENV